MSASTKSKIRKANRLRKIIIDNIGEPKLYSDAMKEYKYLAKEVEKYSDTAKTGQGLKKYWDLDKRKINTLRKALEKNYRFSGLQENTINNIHDVVFFEGFWEDGHNSKRFCEIS